MKTYIVVCQPYDRMDPPLQIDCVKAKNLVDLTKKYDFSDIFDDENNPTSDANVIEAIEDIDISGFDGYTIFEIVKGKMVRIADCGLFG